MKCAWIKDDGTNEPAENMVTEDCSNNEKVTKSGLTGTYYLWVKLKNTTGTKMYPSGAFYFDNTAPTSVLETDWTEEGLKILIKDAIDSHSDIDNNSCKVQIKLENDVKEERQVILENGTGETIITGLDMKNQYKVELTLNDKAGNKLNKQITTKKAIEIINNGRLMNGSFVPGSDGSIGVQNATDYVLKIISPYGGNTGYMSYPFNWNGGDGEVVLNHLGVKTNNTGLGLVGYVSEQRMVSMNRKYPPFLENFWIMHDGNSSIGSDSQKCKFSTSAGERWLNLGGGYSGNGGYVEMRIKTLFIKEI